MMIPFAALMAILITHSIFFLSVLVMVRRVEALSLSNNDWIDRDFFAELQDRLAESADRGKAYSFFLGWGCVLLMFPLDDFLIGDGRGASALFVMWIQMIPLFIAWHLVCHRMAGKFWQENLEQAKKLSGLLKVRGRVRGINRIPGLLLVLTVDMDQETRLFVLPKEVEGKFDWDAAVGSMVLVYYPEKVPVAAYVIVTDPIREDPEHWQDSNPATYVPHRNGDWD